MPYASPVSPIFRRRLDRLGNFVVPGAFYSGVSHAHRRRLGSGKHASKRQTPRLPVGCYYEQMAVFLIKPSSPKSLTNRAFCQTNPSFVKVRAGFGSFFMNRSAFMTAGSRGQGPGPYRGDRYGGNTFRPRQNTPVAGIAKPTCRDSFQLQFVRIQFVP